MARLAPLVLGLFVAACDTGMDPDPIDDAAIVDRDAGPPPADTVEYVVETGNTGAAGEIDVVVPIDGHRSFMVVGTSEGGTLSVLAIEDPSGNTILRWEDWYNASNYLTNAFWADQPATVINWPIRAEDPALVDGDYIVRLGSYRIDGITSRPDVPIEITTATSRDHDLSRGLVRVLIVWADGLAQDAALVSATEAAVAHWVDVWRGAGMELEVRYTESTIDPALPYPSAASGDVLLAASSLADPGEITVIVGEIVNGDATQYGVAGQLPGPIVSTTMSAIVIGWIANAGGDGVFSDNDIGLYGEVLAHEVGHYLGLFHPVEETFDAWDALADTPECGGARGCESMLGTNLMFPYSICDAGVCVSTTVITGDQRGVMQRYTGTL